LPADKTGPSLQSGNKVSMFKTWVRLTHQSVTTHITSS